MASPPTGDQERELDDVLAKIDAATSHIQRKAKKVSKASQQTRMFNSPSRMKRTRMAFQAMCDDPVLFDSGEDLRVEDDEQAALSDTVVLPPPEAKAKAKPPSTSTTARVNGVNGVTT